VHFNNLTGDWIGVNPSPQSEITEPYEVAASRDIDLFD
jgi:hypothetical protein